MRSLKCLDLEDLTGEQTKMLMDLALQATSEEITLNLEPIDIDHRILGHDLMGRISKLELSASEFYSALSKQLTKQSRS
jgi:hypothetical protein